MSLRVSDSADAWVEAIARLIDNPQERRGVARTAQAEVLKRYSLQKNHGRYHETYLRCMENVRPLPAGQVVDEGSVTPGVLILDAAGDIQKIQQTLASLDGENEDDGLIVVLTTLKDAFPNGLIGCAICRLPRTNIPPPPNRYAHCRIFIGRASPKPARHSPEHENEAQHSGGFQAPQLSHNGSNEVGRERRRPDPCGGAPRSHVGLIVSPGAVRYGGRVGSNRSHRLDHDVDTYPHLTIHIAAKPHAACRLPRFSDCPIRQIGRYSGRIFGVWRRLCTNTTLPDCFPGDRGKSCLP